MAVYIQPELSKYTGRVIYKFIAPDKRVYIGKATTSYQRIGAHKREAFAKKDGEWLKNTRWKKAIREFGWENMLVEILEFVPKWTSLDKRERYWIAEYHASNTKYGFNMNKGGGGPTKHTEEAKAKMSAAKMGNTYAPTKPVTCCEILEDGEMQKVKLTSYASAYAAEADLGICQQDISACCTGKGKSAGGYLWWFSKKDEVFGERVVTRVGDVPGTSQNEAVISVLSRGDGQADEQLHNGMNESGRTLSAATGKKFDNGSISKCVNRHSELHKGYNFRRVTTEKREDFDEDFKRTVPYNPELYTIKKR